MCGSPDGQLNSPQPLSHSPSPKELSKAKQTQCMEINIIYSLSLADWNSDKIKAN